MYTMYISVPNLIFCQSRCCKANNYSLTAQLIWTRVCIVCILPPQSRYPLQYVSFVRFSLTLVDCSYNRVHFLVSVRTAISILRHKIVVR